MYRLFEVIKTSEKESQSIYPYGNFTDATADYDIKLGTAMKAERELAHLLLILDEEGRTVANKFLAQTHEEEVDGKTVITTETISPRLIDIKITDEEKANMAKYDTENDVHANFYLKRGRAKQDAEVKAIILNGIGIHGEQIDYDNWVRPIEQEEEPTPEPEQQGE